MMITTLMTSIKTLTTLTILILSNILLNGIVYADSRLIGWDYYGAPFNNTSCFAESNSINDANWKAVRLRAATSGTIEYFKVTPTSVPSGCSDDDVWWAVYEDAGTTSYAGNLKAYGHYVGYDWTSIGAGVHKFNVTNTLTNRTITSGNYYWIVFYAYAIDRDNYSRAGCSGLIYNHRGRETSSCVSGVSSYRQAQNLSYPLTSPPPGGSINVSHNSYFDWSIWEGSGGTTTSTSQLTTSTSTPSSTSTVLDTTPPSSPSGLKVLE